MSRRPRWISSTRPFVLSFALPLGVAIAATGCRAEDELAITPESGESAGDKHYQVALGSFHSSMFDDAKRQTQRALDADPGHERALYLQGLLSLREGKTMIDALESDMCLRDESSVIQRQRADELHRTAHESFRRSAESSGETASNRGRAMNSMAVVSLYFQDNDRAIAEAKSALSADFYSERWSALANLGWAYYQRGDKIEAMTELRQSVMLNPNHCVGRYRLAEVYLEVDMPDQALEEVATVLENPDCQLQNARLIEGLARAQLGDSTGAQNAFDACIALAPRSCLGQECRALVSYASGEPLASGD